MIPDGKDKEIASVFAVVAVVFWLVVVWLLPPA